MKLLLALLLLAAEPHAVATTRGSFPANSVAFVDASGSTSDSPIGWQVIGRPNEPMMTGDPGSTPIKDRKGTFGLFPALPIGQHFVAVVCVGTAEGATAPMVSVMVVALQIGEGTPSPPSPPLPPGPNPIPLPTPKPTPTPPPGPMPDPDPPFPDQTSEMYRLGKTYGKSLIRTCAETWGESASMLAAGNTRKDIMDSFGSRWLARRSPEFIPAAEAMARIAPDAAEPTGPTRDNLVRAWIEFGIGIKESLK